MDGWTAKECECVLQKRFNRRMKSAMIPEEFTEAEFHSYLTQTPIQSQMFDSIKRYLEQFDTLRNEAKNSFGFIAKFGEQRLREIRDPSKRAEIKRLHNNFGLGKTHLQVAAAKELIKRGYTTLIISDVTFMEDLTKSRSYSDDGEEFNRMLWPVLKADVLVWDDIGKAKPTDSRMGMYYRIIDERYRNKKPIIFSSNEDAGSLMERIGDAAASRLFGMSKGWLFAVEGQDYRLASS